MEIFCGVDLLLPITLYQAGVEGRFQSHQLEIELQGAAEGYGQHFDVLGRGSCDISKYLSKSELSSQKQQIPLLYASNETYGAWSAEALFEILHMESDVSSVFQKQQAWSLMKKAANRLQMQEQLQVLRSWKERSGIRVSGHGNQGGHGPFG